METTLENIKMERNRVYKDSGVEWLGVIPHDWDCVRMKFLFKDISIKNRANAELLSVTQNQGVVPRNWVENRMVMPSGNLGSFKFIEKGDFAISLRSFEGGLEFCHHDGIISPAYTVLKAQRNFDSQFYKYLFKCYSFISELQTSVVGIREGKNISYPELSYSFLPIPSKQEQTRIAAFLDRKTAQIDQAIAQKERLIELLKERRQILIQNAVTRGLNPNVRMKDSGVEWIGMIPEHWKVLRVKQCSNKISKGTTPSTEGRSILDEGAIRYIKAENIQDGLITDHPAHFIDEKTNSLIKRSELRENDVLFVIAGATLGKVAIISRAETPSNTNQAVAFVRPNSNVFPRFLSIWLTSSVIKELTWLDAVQSAQPNLSMENLGNFPILLPDFEEQKSIIGYVQNIETKIATAITCKQAEIEKLKEYKATLINSAVTGKIKV